MTAISLLVPDVRTEIPELPGFVAERQLLRATRELAAEARVWRVDIEPSFSAATLDLTSLLPTATELVDVISLKLQDGGPAGAAKTQAWLDLNASNWRSDTGSAANYYILDEKNTIRITPYPDSATAYYARVAVKPTLAATAIDDVVASRYDELIIHGALGRLYAIPRKPWTDLGLAQYHTSMFISGLPDARRDAADEFQTGVGRKVRYGGL